MTSERDRYLAKLMAPFAKSVPLARTPAQLGTATGFLAAFDNSAIRIPVSTTRNGISVRNHVRLDPSQLSKEDAAHMGRTGTFRRPGSHNLHHDNQQCHLKGGDISLFPRTWHQKFGPALHQNTPRTSDSWADWNNGRRQLIIKGIGAHLEQRAPTPPTSGGPGEGTSGGGSSSGSSGSLAARSAYPLSAKACMLGARYGVEQFPKPGGIRLDQPAKLAATVQRRASSDPSPDHLEGETKFSSCTAPLRSQLPPAVRLGLGQSPNLSISVSPGVLQVHATGVPRNSPAHYDLQTADVDLGSLCFGVDPLTGHKLASHAYFQNPLDEALRLVQVDDGYQQVAAEFSHVSPHPELVISPRAVLCSDKYGYLQLTCPESLLQISMRLHVVDWNGDVLYLDGFEDPVAKQLLRPFEPLLNSFNPDSKQFMEDFPALAKMQGYAEYVAAALALSSAASSPAAWSLKQENTGYGLDPPAVLAMEIQLRDALLDNRMYQAANAAAALLANSKAYLRMSEGQPGDSAGQTLEHQSAAQSRASSLDAVSQVLLLDPTWAPDPQVAAQAFLHLLRLLTQHPELHQLLHQELVSALVSSWGLGRDAQTIAAPELQRVLVHAALCCAHSCQEPQRITADVCFEAAGYLNPKGKAGGQTAAAVERFRGKPGYSAELLQSKAPSSSTEALAWAMDAYADAYHKQKDAKPGDWLLAYAQFRVATLAKDDYDAHDYVDKWVANVLEGLGHLCYQLWQQFKLDDARLLLKDATSQRSLAKAKEAREVLKGAPNAKMEIEVLKAIVAMETNAAYCHLWQNELAAKCSA